MLHPRRGGSIRSRRWRQAAQVATASIDPQRPLEGTPWLGPWQESEARMVILSSRVALAFIALAMVAHWFLVDVPLELEPAARWAAYRFGSAAFYVLLLALTFLPAVQRPSLARLPLLAVVLVLGGLQAKTVEWLPTVPYLYAFALTVVPILLMRQAAPGAVATLVAALGTQWLLAWRFTEIPSAKLASATIVSGVVIVVFRARMAGDVRAFLTEKREFDAQKRLIEAQIELDQMKTRFFTNVSHELRTPLTLIIAPVEALLAASRPLPDDVRAELALVQRNAQRLLRQINALLHFARLDATHELLRLEELDPVELLRSLVESSRALADRHGVQLAFVPDGPMPPIPLDRDKVEQIALNLLANAIRFAEGTPDRPGRVRVNCGPHGALFRFVVEDDGIGIPPDHLERVFDRFHQVPVAAGGFPGGTGIGLALVKELAEFHMGSVSVNSRVGEGSRFVVELPLDASVYPPERLDRRAAPPHAHRGTLRPSARLELVPGPSPAPVAGEPAPTADPSAPHLLVVDDNREMLDFVSRELGREFRIELAESADEAQRAIDRSVPDVVVCDLMMPGRPGTELLRAVRADPRTRRVPFVLVTAKVDETSKIESLQGGADEYLTKPFSLPELRARIHSLLVRARLERELADRNELLSKVNFDLVLSKRQVLLDTMEAFALAVEAKDPYTHGHSRRVSILAERLGADLGLSEREREMVRIAGILHDVGKIGTPESVLSKPGRLEAEEAETFKRHARLGHRIVSAVRELEGVGLAILHHHERFDGEGYPDGLHSDAIPILSRVLAVADTYDAMTSNRPYRTSLGHRAAIDEILRCSGTQLDPACARAFVRLFESAPPEYPDFPSALLTPEAPERSRPPAAARSARGDPPRQEHPDAACIGAVGNAERPR